MRVAVDRCIFSILARTRVICKTLPAFLSPFSPGRPSTRDASSHKGSIVYPTEVAGGPKGLRRGPKMTNKQALPRPPSLNHYCAPLLAGRRAKVNARYATVPPSSPTPSATFPPHPPPPPPAWKSTTAPQTHPPGNTPSSPPAARWCRGCTSAGCSWRRCGCCSPRRAWRRGRLPQRSAPPRWGGCPRRLRVQPSALATRWGGARCSPPRACGGCRGPHPRRTPPRGEPTATATAAAGTTAAGTAAAAAAGPRGGARAHRVARVHPGRVPLARATVARMRCNRSKLSTSGAALGPRRPSAGLPDPTRVCK